MVRCYSNFYGSWSDMFKVLFEQLCDFFWVLIWYQVYVDFGIGFGRQYCFCVFFNVFVLDVVDIQGWVDGYVF